MTVSVPGREVRGPALLDSGADNILVPAEAIANLGIDFASLPVRNQSVGAGGGFETRSCVARIRYGEWKICDGFAVAEPGKLDQILLGRDDVFSRFVIRFDGWRKQPPEFEMQLYEPGMDTIRPKKKRR